jgi:hypothetical protein
MSSGYSMPSSIVNNCDLLDRQVYAWTILAKTNQIFSFVACRDSVITIVITNDLAHAIGAHSTGKVLLYSWSNYSINICIFHDSGFLEMASNQA